jgi:SAM-dependent methyltransferase
MSDSRRISAASFAATIFLSAFLLFQVQPLLSKYILPWFGGTPAVWTTCMLFFQTLLFGGYAYAHFLTQRLSHRAQAVVHLSVLLAAALSCPISPSEVWKPAGGENPTPLILQLLTASVGLPFFALSATGPLLQSWFSRVHTGASPYRLYALSNIGSLLALVTYPFLFEPAFDTAVQLEIWSWGFVAFAVSCAVCAVRAGRVELRVAGAGPQGSPGDVARRGFASLQPRPHVAEETDADVAEKPTWGVRLLWFLLAMTASVMLLATTNQVCMDVASVPFLWVLPLTLYLMTFILCFDSDRWYSRKWYAISLCVSVLCVCVVMMKGAGGSLIAQVLVYFAGLFICAMVCHGELVRLKPSPRHLTSFYLVISAGGAAGGLFVGVVAPLLFPIYLEMHVALFGVWALMMMVFFRDRGWALYTGRPRWAWGGLLLGVFVLTALLRVQANDNLNGAVEVARNFYGVLRVQEKHPDDPDLRCYRLMHGRIVHGLQFQSPKKRLIPTSYYGRQSAVGQVLEHVGPHRPLHVGVVGLGIGTVAAYAKPGDRYRFYEINPEVIRLARKHFTFLASCRGKVTIVTGDARQMMEREPPQQFDVLVVDAFSGDAIPTHLVSREAFDVYRRHLKPGGVLAFHISNLYFDLRPVLASAAGNFGWQSLVVVSLGDRETGTKDAMWMVMARDLARPEFAALRKAGQPYDGPTIEWTDSRNNLVEILR